MADPWKLDEEEKKRRRLARAAKRRRGNRKDKDVKKKANYTLVKGAKKPPKRDLPVGPGKALRKPLLSTSAKAIKARASKRLNPDNKSKDVKKKPNYTLVKGAKKPPVGVRPSRGRIRRPL